MTDVIVTEKLSRWYGDVMGVSDMTVSLGPGVMGFLGPNGAGKSTFIKLAMGLLKPSQGTIRVYGERPWNNPRLMSRVGYCPEGDSFYEGLTGSEFLDALLRLNGITKAARRDLINSVLQTVGLSEAADRKIGSYSKGMRQRLKMAQALAHEPELFVLDEPLTGMDPVGRREMIDLIRRLGAEGRTVIVSSHILHEVEAMTQQILLINRGKILAVGDVHQIRELMDSYPHHIRIKCSDPRGLAGELASWKGVVSLELIDEASTLMVKTVLPDAFYDGLCRKILQMGITLAELESTDDNLQAVINYLVK